ncbi:MAG TPA: WD40 repeat domain-containing protein [Bacteroidia bacterium]|jgi:WD40 repeat protein
MKANITRSLLSLTITAITSVSVFGQSPLKREMEIVPGDYYTVSFSPDNKYVVGTSFSTIKYSETMTLRAGGTQVFNVETGAKEMAKTDRPALCAVFKSDGKEILSAELSNGPQTFPFKGEAEKALTLPNDEVAFTLLYSADGQEAIIGTVQGHVHIMDIATDKLKRTININDAGKIVISLHLANDGKTLITHSGGIIQYWEYATGKELKKIVPENSRQIGYMAMSADKKTMISQCDTIVSIWDVDKMAVKKTFVTGWKYCGAVSPDGSLIALGFDGGFYTFNGQGEVIRGWGGDGVDIKTLAFSPDGKLCAAGLGAGSMYLFDAGILATKAE